MDWSFFFFFFVSVDPSGRNSGRVFPVGGILDFDLEIFRDFFFFFLIFDS